VYNPQFMLKIVEEDVTKLARFVSHVIHTDLDKIKSFQSLVPTA
jgi:hypothetical protein